MSLLCRMWRTWGSEQFLLVLWSDTYLVVKAVHCQLLQKGFRLRSFCISSSSFFVLLLLRLSLGILELVFHFMVHRCLQHHVTNSSHFDKQWHISLPLHSASEMHKSLLSNCLSELNGGFPLLFLDAASVFLIFVYFTPIFRTTFQTIVLLSTEAYLFRNIPVDVFSTYHFFESINCLKRLRWSSG